MLTKHDILLKGVNAQNCYRKLEEFGRGLLLIGLIKTQPRFEVLADDS
jgi:hypothetical protein